MKCDRSITLSSCTKKKMSFDQKTPRCHIRAVVFCFQCFVKMGLRPTISCCIQNIANILYETGVLSLHQTGEGVRDRFSALGVSTCNGKKKGWRKYGFRCFREALRSLITFLSSLQRAFYVSLVRRANTLFLFNHIVDKNAR